MHYDVTKHIEQSDIYFKYKGKKKLTETEQIRKSVTSILRQEQREQQLRRAQGLYLRPSEVTEITYVV